jgi:hypothetical protein
VLVRLAPREKLFGDDQKDGEPDDTPCDWVESTSGSWQVPTEAQHGQDQRAHAESTAHRGRNIASTLVPEVARYEVAEHPEAESSARDYNGRARKRVADLRQEPAQAELDRSD